MEESDQKLAEWRRLIRAGQVGGGKSEVSSISMQKTDER
jgi:hypothetical protein